MFFQLAGHCQDIDVEIKNDRRKKLIYRLNQVLHHSKFAIITSTFY